VGLNLDGFDVFAPRKKGGRIKAMWALLSKRRSRPAQTGKRVYAPGQAI
jgi:hypothetical protein